MKNDSSRFTFAARKHFSSVRRQQGRVQIDADGNEQSDIVNYRIETEARDVIGLCGAPMHYPAFHIVGALSELNTEEKALPGNAALPAGFKLPDFLISAGRYYVDGILCENEGLTSYLKQPDLLDAPPLTEAGLYLIYVDVWQRLLTALDDPSIREIALGGPDTATRAKTVWQVKYWPVVVPDGKKVDGNCLTKFEVFEKLIAPSDGKLSARTKPPQANTNPCIVPPGAGYTGLENQLYRVEIHDSGSALDATTVGLAATRVPDKNDQIRVGGTWQVGQPMEVFSSKAGEDPLNGTLAYVTKVAINKKVQTLTLSTDVSKIDELRVRPAKATFKWSRDNGVVVQTIQSITGQEVTVHDLGPDDALGFKVGQWVEISDDELELKGLAGQLAQITNVDSAVKLITLNVAPALGLDQARHPKLRRWDGVGAVKFVSGDHFLDLETGVQVRFFAGSFRTGDYWTTAARTATADTRSGNIDWPRDAASEPVPQLPFGIKHHYCRLAMLHWDGKNFDVVSDCRSLFPPITELTSLLYVNGAGQESMPNRPQPQALQAGVFNGRWAVPGARVQFTASDDGQLAADISGLPASMPAGSKTVTVNTGADGVASCAWKLDPDVNRTSQQVEARLLDADGKVTPALVRFDGNLSIADQVAYFPGECQPLQESRTVQRAIDKLSHFVSLYEVSGNNQEIVPGETLQPLVVLAANRCGAVTDQKLKVHFKVVSGGGKVNGQPEADVLTDAKGQATCDWAPGPSVPNQEVEASLVADPSHSLAEPTKVRFTSTLSLARHVFYDPGNCPGLKAEQVVNVQDAIDHLCEVHQGGCCDVTVGPGGQFEQLEEAIKQLAGDKQTDICICLLPGDHLIKNGLTIEGKDLNVEGKDLNVKIVGCGRGSRLIFDQTPAGAGNSFNAVGLGGLTLRDLMMFGSNFFFDQCEDITIAGCYLIQDKQGSPFIRVGRAKRIRFEGNVISATLPMKQDGTAFRATPGVAIVLIDGDAETWIEDNNINGVVSLYGAPGKVTLTAGDLHRLSAIVKNGRVVFANPVASLHIRDNVMYRLDVSGETIGLLKSATANKGATLEHAYRRCFVTNNVFSGGENVFVMDHLALTSNSFEQENELDVGSVIGNTAVYLGNHAPNGIRLFSAVPNKEKAANLTINIVDI